MTRGRLAVHGHFYQPSRVDPWTGRVPEEPAAAPFHDWNARVDAECYRPNAVRSNLTRISWDLGPTLASWLATEDAATLDGFATAARGGNAIAQAFHHTILPLASEADRRTEIRWGLREFELRFGHRASGLWLPETVHRAHAGNGVWRALVDLSRRAHLRLLFAVDFSYWMAFAVYQTTFALFGEQRFGFDASHIGYLLSAFGFLGVLVQGVLVGPIAATLGERRTLVIGLLSAALGWGGSALTHSVPLFIVMLAPGAVGIGLCNATLSSLISKAAGPREQGRVQGAAGALESLGRTVGPVWGNGTLQRFGEGTAYGAAALILVGAAALTTRYRLAMRQEPRP